MVAALKVGRTSLEASLPRELFALPASLGGLGLNGPRPYEVAPDAQHFLASDIAAGTEPLTVIVNWQELLKKGAGTNDRAGDLRRANHGATSSFLFRGHQLPAIPPVSIGTTFGFWVRRWSVRFRLVDCEECTVSISRTTMIGRMLDAVLVGLEAVPK